MQGNACWSHSLVLRQDSPKSCLASRLLDMQTCHNLVVTFCDTFLAHILETRKCRDVSAFCSIRSMRFRRPVARWQGGQRPKSLSNILIALDGSQSHVVACSYSTSSTFEILCKQLWIWHLYPGLSMAHSISFPPPCTLSVTRAPKESLLQHDAARSNLHFSFEQTDSSCCLRLSLARSVSSEVCKCDNDRNMQSLTHSLILILWNTWFLWGKPCDLLHAMSLFRIYVSVPDSLGAKPCLAKFWVYWTWSKESE